jgi:hypothetical protein
MSSFLFSFLPFLLLLSTFAYVAFLSDLGRRTGGNTGGLADDRWYMDASYPSMVAHYLYKLGLIHGHAKIQYTLLSMVRPLPFHPDSDHLEYARRREEGADAQNLPGGIFEIMQGYMKYGSTFNIEGSEF